MNCFYHPDVVAVGLCKSCHRGLCSHCAADVNNSIACIDRCETKVMKLDEIINVSERTSGKSEKLISMASPGASAAFTISLGSMFVYMGAQTKHPVMWAIFGGIFIVTGLNTLWKMYITYKKE